MATPFFRGNYGSALSRVDTRPIMEGGRARAQMFENMGAQLGGMIQQYGLNKEKRDKAEAAFQGDFRRLLKDNREELEAMKEDPVLGPTLKRIEEGKGTLKDFDKYNAYRAADKEATIEKLELDNAKTQQGMNELNLSLQEALKDPTIKKAIADARTAEDESMYAKSIASAEYAAKVEDNRLKAAQTENYDARSKAEKNSKAYTPGQRVDVKGISGNKVSFVWTGNSLQPLNDRISQKTIDEAIVQGLDPAQLNVYLDDNYDYDEKTQDYKFKGKGNMVGYGGGVKNPMMEQAITILGMRGKIKPESEEPTATQPESDEPTVTQPESVPPSVPTVTTQEEFDALPSGAIFIEDGVQYKKP